MITVPPPKTPAEVAATSGGGGGGSGPFPDPRRSAFNGDLVHNVEYGLWVPEKADRLGSGVFKRACSNHALGSKLISVLAKGHKLCVQAGGNLGIFPNFLAGFFEEVVTFEPHPILFQCLAKNRRKNVYCYPTALGQTNKTVEYHMLGPLNGTLIPCLGWHKFDIVSCDVPMVAIDSLNLTACDALVLDIERGEGAALLGAKETIAKFRPVIQVEQDGGDSLRPLEDVVQLLVDYGYASHKKVGRDMVWLPCS